jgi:hypothetical protein
VFAAPPHPLPAQPFEPGSDSRYAVRKRTGFTVLYLALKFIVSAAVIVAVSEVAKRHSGIAALLAALPLTSLLAFVWLHVEGSPPAAIGTLSTQIFWLVLPSLVLFLALPALLKWGVGFWPSLALAAGATVACYLVMLPLLRKVGVQL